MSLEAEVKTLKSRVENLEETVDVILDKELMESVKRGLKDIEEGRVISLEDYEKTVE